VRQFSACFGVSAFAHLVWHSSFTPQMALGEQSLHAHSCLEEPPFSSQYRYAFASSTIHTNATNISAEAKVMAFMEIPKEFEVIETTLSIGGVLNKIVV
jgi:hypothetical protein